MALIQHAQQLCCYFNIKMMDEMGFPSSIVH